MEDELLIAAREGNVDRIKQMLGESKAKINWKNIRIESSFLSF